MLHNKLSIKEKNIQRIEMLNKDDALNYIFYSVRNIFAFLFEREIEDFFKNKGFSVDVLLKADSRYQSVNFIFHDKKKTVERSTFLKKESIGNIPFSEDVSSIFYKVESLAFGEYYRYQKPHFDIQVDDLLNSDEFKSFFENLVLLYLIYPFNDSRKYEDKIIFLREKRTRKEFVIDLISRVNTVLPFYYKNMVKKEIYNKKYDINDFFVNDNSFIFSMKTNKDDIFEIKLSFKREKEILNGIENDVFIAGNVEVVLISRGEENKKSIKAISKEINDFYLDESMIAVLKDSLNIINLPYTYESKLST